MLTNLCIRATSECGRSVVARARPRGGVARQCGWRWGCAQARRPRQWDPLFSICHTYLSTIGFATASNSTADSAAVDLLHQPKEVDPLPKHLAPIKWLLIRNKPTEAFQQLKSVLQQHGDEISQWNIESIIRSTIFTLPNYQTIEILAPVLKTETQRKFAVELILKTALANAPDPAAISEAALFDQITSKFPEFNNSSLQIQAARLFLAALKMTQRRSAETNAARRVVGILWTQILTSSSHHPNPNPNPEHLDEVFDFIAELNSFGVRKEVDCEPLFRTLSSTLLTSLDSLDSISTATEKSEQIITILRSFQSKFLLHLFSNLEIRVWRRLKQAVSLRLMVDRALNLQSQLTPDPASNNDEKATETETQAAAEAEALSIRLLYAAYSADQKTTLELYESAKQLGVVLNSDVFFALSRILANDKLMREHATVLADWSAFQRAQPAFAGFESRYFDQLIINRIALASLEDARAVLEALVAASEQQQQQQQKQPEPISPLLFSRVVVGYCRNGDLRSAIGVYNLWLQQPRATFPLTSEHPSMLVSLLSAAVATGQSKLAAKLSEHALEILGMDLQGDLLFTLSLQWTNNNSNNENSKSNDLTRLWDDLFKPVQSGLVHFADESAKNALITHLLKTFGSAGQGERVEEIWASLTRSKFVAYPDAVAISAYLFALCKCNKIERMFQYMRLYMSYGKFGVDAIVYHSFVRALQSISGRPLTRSDLTAWEHQLRNRSKALTYNRSLTSSEKERFSADMNRWERLHAEHSRRVVAAHPQQPTANQSQQTANLH